MRARRRWTYFLVGSLAVVAGLLLWAQEPAPPPQAPPPQSPPTGEDPEALLRRRVELYLRYVFAWGPRTQVRVGPLRESALPGLYTTLIEAFQGDARVQEVLLVSPDGRYLIKGDLLDTTEDPFAEALQTISTANQPTKGTANAPVTIVEYGDFQCPDCARFYPILKKLVAERKDVRLIFKDLPLTAKHNWALPAAVAAQCAYQQSNQAFWRLHDYLYENQKQLTAKNLDARLDAFAPTAGLNPDKFRACRQQQLTRSRVQQSLREAAALNLINTPTTFVNGRPLPGVQSRAYLDQLIEFEVALRQQGRAKP